LLDRVMKPKI